jgi:hypothetical protein
VSESLGGCGVVRWCPICGCMASCPGLGRCNVWCAYVRTWLCSLICVYGVFCSGAFVTFFFCLIQRYVVLLCVQEKKYFLMVYHTVQTQILIHIRALTPMNTRMHTLLLRAPPKDRASLILKFTKSVKECLTVNGDVVYH